jgi:hypothetical protein
MMTGIVVGHLATHHPSAALISLMMFTLLVILVGARRPGQM